MAGNLYDERSTEFNKVNTNDWSYKDNTSTAKTIENEINQTTATDPYKYYCPSIPRGETGWICPRCGRGVAPWKSYCDCGDNWTITCKTSTPSTGTPVPDWNHVTCKSQPGVVTRTSSGAYIYSGPTSEVHLTN